MELLTAAAIGAAVIGASAIAFSALARFTGNVAETVTVTLDNTKLSNYYGAAGTTINSPVAPNLSAGAQAEALREQFLADTQTATAVFCLARADINTYRPDRIPFVPDADPFPDTSEKFRALLVRKSLVAATLYHATQRPYNDTVSNASIFVLGFSDDPFYLKVTAVWDIDVVKTSSDPKGFYASVKRYVATSLVAAQLTGYYSVFYPAYNGSGLDGQPATWPTTTDTFAPLWVAFENRSRADVVPPEATTIQRFKVARERPFYLIWWPDPNAKTLGLYGASNSSYPTTDPRKAYNHMAGRTSFMFCVPVFPSI